MKKHYFLLFAFLLSCFAVSSQDKQTTEPDKQEKANRPNFTPSISIGFTTNYFYGDNYMAQGHNQPNYGLTYNQTVVKYSGFALGFDFGAQFARVNDYSLGGRIKNSDIISFGALLRHIVTISESTIIEPEIGITPFTLRQSYRGKHYGTHEGNRYKIGANFVHAIEGALKLYTSLSYSYFKHQIETTAEFNPYFKTSHMLSLAVGIRLL